MQYKGNFCRQAALLFLVGVIVALAVIWQDGRLSGRGTSGQWEFVDPCRCGVRRREG